MELRNDFIKNLKLYRLTDSDYELLKNYNIELEISYILKLEPMSFKEALGTYFYGRIFEDIPPILVIGKIWKFRGFYSAISDLNYSAYKKIKKLDNLTKYTISMLIQYNNCSKLAWEHKLNDIFILQLHAEVTKIYIHIFNIKEICKICNIYDDIKNYIIKFLL